MPLSALVPFGFVQPLLAQSGAGSLFWENFVNHVVATVLYAAIGLCIFSLAFAVIARLTPFSIRKEIEDDQNIALAIIIGSVFIGIAIIIAAAVHG